MRISTVRQLSRVLGTFLAEHTASAAESQQLMKDVVACAPVLDNYGDLRDLTVRAIVEAHNLEQATLQAVQVWQQLAKEGGAKPSMMILALVGVIRASTTEMLHDLLTKPAQGNSNQSMDGSICTSFDNSGAVESIQMRVIRGRFSIALLKTLRTSDNLQNQHHDASLKKEVASPADRPDGVRFTLTEDYGGRQRNQVHTFTITKEDFVNAYIAATLDYGAVAYADRVRIPGG